ncbi:MAG TPA: carboxypeptidase-like regulatory domain-containing protein [Bryobacteraceae bacterium]
MTDPTRSAIPNATVTLTNTNTRVARTVTTNGEGAYRFAFVPPSTYSVSVSVPGFATQERSGIVVAAGQPTAANFQLQVAGSSTTVVVSESGGALQTENADVATSFDSHTIENMPNPGGDITYIAQTAPGVVMNTQAGYGNFIAEGMPATSNLFTVNGVNNNDPFFGINNSGASNLLLGSNDIAETSVINNGYSGQYGEYAGSQITYTTKSGTSRFHGDAIYMWNGRALNANQFFSNSSGLPTPFNNFNQWQTDVNGPIWRNFTFFDVDYEGVQNVLPTAANLNLIPSPQFQAATLANLGANGNAAELPFYRQVFAIYNGAPGAGSATPVPASQGYGCQGFTGLGAGVSCAFQFRSTPPALIHEYQWSGRVDHTISDKDRVFVRVLRDNGFQPTFTSAFGPTPASGAVPTASLAAGHSPRTGSSAPACPSRSSTTPLTTRCWATTTTASFSHRPRLRSPATVPAPWIRLVSILRSSFRAPASQAFPPASAAWDAIPSTARISSTWTCRS